MVKTPRLRIWAVRDGRTVKIYTHSTQPILRFTELRACDAGGCELVPISELCDRATTYIKGLPDQEVREITVAVKR